MNTTTTTTSPEDRVRRAEAHRRSNAAFVAIAQLSPDAGRSTDSAELQKFALAWEKQARAEELWAHIFREERAAGAEMYARQSRVHAAWAREAQRRAAAIERGERGPAAPIGGWLPSRDQGLQRES